MKCMRCGKSDRMSRVNGLSFQFQGEDVLNNSVSVTGFHCGHCQFLMLTMDPSAVPAVALDPVKE
ncbi:MAG: hypothetical protein DMG31_09185 [Acidobacteria bacterium]|nr:MAG: hypothetical protein DMG31_09185 [Acidobacteriota bacterium]